MLLANALFFSVLGGALLTRYLLPMYPLVLLIAVSTFYRRVPFWQTWQSLSAGAFIAGLFINPPYRFAPEDNLEYARVVRLHMAGIAQLQQSLSRVNSVFSVARHRRVDEARTRVCQGALTRCTGCEDFTAGQIDRAADEPGGYSTALVFSTKYDPPPCCLSLGPKSEGLDQRYFGFIMICQPEAIALRLHGALNWQREDHAQWIALIRFNRQFDAQVRLPDAVR